MPTSSPTPVLADDRDRVTLILAIAAVGGALIAILGDQEGVLIITVMSSLVGLVPWALVVGGVRLTPSVFAVMGVVPSIVGVVIGQSPGAMFPAIMVVTWLAWSTDDRVLIGVSTVASAASIIVLAVITGSFHEAGAVYFVGGLGIALLAGFLLRRQEKLTEQLRVANEQRVEHARIAERARIAREIHDVVAHSLTVVMLHVGGARRSIHRDPEGTAKALERAESVGRDSLDSIRQVVGLLRETDGSAGNAIPMPGLAEVPLLVEEFRGAGLPITLTYDLDADAVGDATGLVAYRLVQEALSNVVQHAAGASTTVECRRGDGDSVLVVEVGNTASSVRHVVAGADRAGLGLVGMGERVAALGGTFDAAPTGSGGWRVRAVLPSASPSASPAPSPSPSPSPSTVTAGG